MNSLMGMGLFALFVAGLSLYRIMKDGDRDLSLLRRTWGNRPGLLLHFLSHVAIPLLVAIVFISRGLTELPQISSPSLSELTKKIRVIFEAPPSLLDRRASLNSLIEGISLFYTGEVFEACKNTDHKIYKDSTKFRRGLPL